MDEQADPGACQIVRMKGAFAIELLPKVPKPPEPEGGFHNPGHGYGNEEYKAPTDPKVRPQVMRWAGNTGVSAAA